MTPEVLSRQEQAHMRLRPHERATALLRVDQALGLQQRDRAPHRRPARPVALGELVLRRQPLASVEPSVQDRRPQLVNDALIRKATWQYKSRVAAPRASRSRARALLDPTVGKTDRAPTPSNQERSPRRHARARAARRRAHARASRSPCPECPARSNPGARGRALESPESPLPSGERDSAAGGESRVIAIRSDVGVCGREPEDVGPA
jgi:hypothetical protein